MGLKQAIMSRCSRRSYTGNPLEEEDMVTLFGAIEECNRAGGLNIQMITEEKGAFSGMKGSLFVGVRNYFVLAGREDDPDLDEKLGYYGESLVLLATQLGLGTCWVGSTYDEEQVKCSLEEGETVRCLIALGNVKEKETAREKAIAKAIKRKTKEIKDMLVAEEQPENWVVNGMRCVVRAPSARNRQPVTFFYSDQAVAARVKEEGSFELFDLGIAKLHFEIGAGRGRWEFGNGGIFEYEGTDH
ncbi:MAG: nitroreductase family protein [Eubacteriaceae bacterium]|nr:nitroreductase family protein [Eubacteriaceae bacterium]